MRFDSAGIAVDLPPGWEASVFRREEVGPRAAALADDVRARTAPGATTHPVLHAASFPMPAQRGDYGSGAVDVMGARDVFVTLLEFHPDAARTALFARPGVPPPLRPHDFSPNGLQRALPGQSGCQRFFSVAGRAFCLYVVLGSHARREMLAPVVNGFLATLSVSESP